MLKMRPSMGNFPNTSSLWNSLRHQRDVMALKFKNLYRLQQPHELLRRQFLYTNYPRSHHSKHAPDSLSRRDRKRRDLEAKAVAITYLTLVLFPAAAFFPTIFLILKSYQQVHPSKYLEKQRLEDLEETVLEEEAMPTHIASLKSTSQHYRSLVYKDEIRILVLHPGEFGDEIFFHMETVDLQKRGRKYEALSYTWGTEPATNVIRSVQGTKVPVTRNLYSALQHLRYRDRIRVLWVDALYRSV